MDPKTLQSLTEKYPEWGKDIDLIVMPPTSPEILEEFPESQGSDIHKPYYTSYGVSRGAQYMHLRRRGMSHRMSEMIACQSAPSIMTDSVFKAGLPTVADEMSASGKRTTYIKNIIDQAKRRGFNPPKNSTYMPALARHAGDREAFVPSSEGRGYIKKLCERRGWACEGAVNVAGQEALLDPHTGGKRLAEDRVRAVARDMAKDNPDILRKDRKQLRHEIVEKHGY